MTFIRRQDNSKHIQGKWLVVSFLQGTNVPLPPLPFQTKLANLYVVQSVSQLANLKRQPEFPNRWERNWSETTETKLQHTAHKATISHSYNNAQSNEKQGKVWLSKEFSELTEKWTFSGQCTGGTREGAKWTSVFLGSIAVGCERRYYIQR